MLKITPGGGGARERQHPYYVHRALRASFVVIFQTFGGEFLRLRDLLRGHFARDSITPFARLLMPT